MLINIDLKDASVHEAYAYVKQDDAYIHVIIPSHYTGMAFRKTEIPSNLASFIDEAYSHGSDPHISGNILLRRIGSRSKIDFTNSSFSFFVADDEGTETNQTLKL